MNKTKYQPGDKVRVKSDLVEYNKKYYMENNDIGHVFVESMSYLKGKIVTISKITSSGVYGIEEDGYSWTDEMFEDVVPQYFECIKAQSSIYSNFTVGKIYQGIELKNNMLTVLNDIGRKLEIPNVLLGDEVLGDTDFKFSTKQAYEAQFKPKTPKFEVGKWYKNLGSDGNYIGKFEKLEETRWYCSDHIYKGVHRNYGGNLTYVFENAVECTVEEIQQYLPDGHPDKKFSINNLVVGEVYFFKNISGEYLFLFEGEANCCKNINLFIRKYFTRGDFERVACDAMRVATPEEKQWLNACIKVNKFLTKEEALKPVIKPWGVGSYVVFVHNYGNSYVGDVDRIKTDASMRDRIVVCEKEGITTTNPEFVKWFATLEEAEAFAKTLKPVIVLGTYDVKVTSNGVKIGCTTLPVDDVIGVLDDFMKISRKFGTESSDYIMINGVKVTYEIANKLLEFIGDN